MSSFLEGEKHVCPTNGSGCTPLFGAVGGGMAGAVVGSILVTTVYCGVINDQSQCVWWASLVADHWADWSVR